MTAQLPPRPWLEAYADNYRNDEVVLPHCHAQAQLIHGVAGVMVVSTAQGSWLVPSGHALWVPAGTPHEILNGVRTVEKNRKIESDEPLPALSVMYHISDAWKLFANYETSFGSLQYA
jgi:hypothetical protein